MSTNQVAVFNPGAMRPAFAAPGAMSAIAKALAGGGGGGKRLSIKGGVFRLIADGKEVATIDDRYLDVVVVNAAPKVSRVFYAGSYVEGAAAAPACWSADGDKPDASISAPQGNTCAACPQNVKGSGQGESRACRYNQHLAIVLANDIEGDVMQLSMAATSIFGKAEGENRPLQEYVRYMMAQGIDFTGLVTRLKFDTKAPVPKLFFKAMRWLTDEEFAICQTQGTSPEAIKAITMTVSQTDGVAPAAPLDIPGTRPAAAVAKPKPAALPPEEDDEPPAPAPKTRAKKAAPAPLPPEPDDEPVVRKAAPAAAAAVPSTSSLAKTLSDWDDE